MYSRIGKLRKKNLIITALGVLSAVIIVVGVLLNQQQTKSTGFTTKAKAEVIEKTVAKSTSEASTSKEKVNQEVTAETESSEAPVVAEPEVAQVQEAAVQQVATDTTATVTTTSYSTSSAVLSNGNTAGEIGTSAAAQMAAATGVSQTVWEQIIARESNGNPYVSNGSGASGLFQTMPGWGSTATVQDQINSAINAYNAQGLSAWGY